MYDEEWDDMDTYDEEFEDMIAEALAFTKNKKESLIKKWLNKINFTEPIGYDISFGPNVATIYTKHPGVLIGKYGANVNEFYTMLAEEFGGKWEVKFVEVHGGFVNV